MCKVCACQKDRFLNGIGKDHGRIVSATALMYSGCVSALPQLGVVLLEYAALKKAAKRGFTKGAKGGWLSALFGCRLL